MPAKKIVSKIDGLIVRPSGSWVRKKHHYLTEYVEIFTTGMGKKWKSLTYVYLFAGPGRCYIKSERQEIEGSPLLMLQYNFSDYIFVEKDKESIAALRERCRRSPKFDHINFVNADCHQTIEQVVQKIPTQSLGLAFIDPTDINIPFSTVQSLSSTRYGVDLIINVQLGMDIKRNFELYKSEGNDSKLGRFLGGNVEWDQIHDTIDVIKLYKQRIGKLGYSTVEYKDISVHNTKRTEMYFLLFASKHPRGLYFWDQITKKDHLGQKELF